MLQVLLTAYENDNAKADELNQAKRIVLELLNIPKNNEEYTRFRKMKKKYQQLVAGI